MIAGLHQQNSLEYLCHIPTDRHHHEPSIGVTAQRWAVLKPRDYICLHLPQVDMSDLSG